MTEGELIEGVGLDVNAALLDALANAKDRDAVSFDARVEVVAWGAEDIGIGGARSVWVQVRKIRKSGAS